MFTPQSDGSYTNVSGRVDVDLVFKKFLEGLRAWPSSKVLMQ